MIPIPFPKNVKELIPRTGLIGEWLFTGNANDTSGNGMNGTLYGSPSLVTPVNNALNLGANKYMVVADNDLLSFTNGSTDIPFSLSIRLKLDSIVANGFAMLICKRDSSSLYQYAEWQLSYSWGVYGNVGVGFTLIDKVHAATINVVTNEQLSFGTVYNLVVTYNGNGQNTGLEIYIDKVNKTNRGGSGSYTRTVNTVSNVTVGKAGWDNIGTFNGFVDSIRLYNRILTTAEITALYNE
jgi:Concanavalin A-like lectin/glucanases superfamily